jgi:predicted GNAT family N-acyltransferase
MPLKIELLTREHVRGGFDCEEPSLNRFLREIALQHDKRNIGRTFVATEPPDRTALGYYTLATGKVEFENLPDAKNLPPIPIPVMLLGRLAVDKSGKGTGLGKLLLMHALWRVHLVSKHAGVYAIEVHAIDEQAAAFYAHYGFKPLSDNARHMYLSMKDVAELELDFATEI